MRGSIFRGAHWKQVPTDSVGGVKREKRQPRPVWQQSWKLLSVNWWIHRSPLFSILHICLETSTMKTQPNKAGCTIVHRGCIVCRDCTICGYFSAAIPEELSSIPRTQHVSSQLSGTPFPGHPTASSSLSGHYTHVVHRNTSRQGTHTHSNKFFF